MDTSLVRTLHFPCRLGEFTLWSPRRNLRVYAVGLFDAVSEEDLVEDFRRNGEDVSGALLYGIRVDEASPALSRHGDLLRYMPQGGNRFIIDLGATFEGYLGTFNGKTRSTLRRKVRRFERESGGECDLREYRGADALQEFFPLARQVSEKTYQERLLDAGLPDDETFRQELVQAGRTDTARGFLLFHHGQPVAYLYTPVSDGVMRYEYVGYDPDHGNLSPGTVLLMLVLERAFADEALRVFDFTEGGGDDSHKSFFATENAYCANVYLLKPTLGNLVLVSAQLATGALSSAVGGVLDRVGVKARVREALRRRGREVAA